MNDFLIGTGNKREWVTQKTMSGDNFADAKHAGTIGNGVNRERETLFGGR